MISTSECMDIAAESAPLLVPAFCGFQGENYMNAASKRRRYERMDYITTTVARNIAHRGSQLWRTDTILCTPSTTALALLSGRIYVTVSLWHQLKVKLHTGKESKCENVQWKIIIKPLGISPHKGARATKKRSAVCVRVRTSVRLCEQHSLASMRLHSLDGELIGTQQIYRTLDHAVIARDPSDITRY